MTTSLAQKDCLTTSSSSDTITFIDNSNTIDLSTITLTGSGYTSGYGISSNTITCIPCYPSNSFCFTNGSTINVASIDTSSIWNRHEFVDCMPDITRIEAMCKEYPGLLIAFEKFKTTYRLVKDDYDTPKDQRPRP